MKLKMALVIIGFVAGFLSATYWKGGREIIEDNAPSLGKHLESGLEKGASVIKEGASKAKKKIKDSL